MHVIEVATGKKKPVIIREIEEEDFKILTRKRFSFGWKTFKNSTSIYTLRIESEDCIFGVMGLLIGRKSRELK